MLPIISPYVDLSLLFYSKGFTCVTEEPLLKGSNPIPDSYFTASSVYSNFAAYTARMDGTADYWCSTTADRDASPPTLVLQVSQICGGNILNIFNQTLLSTENTFVMDSARLTLKLCIFPVIYLILLYDFTD